MNLYSSLARWATRQDENVLTEAFVHLVRTTLDREPEAGVRFLSRLCFGDAAGAMPPGVILETQWDTDLGRPDVRIEAPDTVCLLEVKKWSGFGPTQLARYDQLLGREPHNVRRLVLLTATEVVADTSVPTHRVRWADVAVWLRGLPIRDSVVCYLIAQFLDFLTAEGLTMEPVTADLAAGTVAYCRLLGMVEAGMKRAGLPVYSKTSDWGRSLGWYVGAKKEYWVGVGYADPEQVRFAFLTAAADRDGYAALGRGDWNRGRPVLTLDLSDPALTFYSLDAHPQLDIITDFLKAAYSDCRRITQEQPVATGTPPAPG